MPSRTKTPVRTPSAVPARPGTKRNMLLSSMASDSTANAVSHPRARCEEAQHDVSLEQAAAPSEQAPAGRREEVRAPAGVEAADQLVEVIRPLAVVGQPHRQRLEAAQEGRGSGAKVPFWSPHVMRTRRPHRMPRLASAAQLDAAGEVEEHDRDAEARRDEKGLGGQVGVLEDGHRGDRARRLHAMAQHAHAHGLAGDAARGEIVQGVAHEINAQELRKARERRPGLHHRTPSQDEGNLRQRIQGGQAEEPPADRGEVGLDGRPARPPHQNQRQRDSGQEEDNSGVSGAGRAPFSREHLDRSEDISRGDGLPPDLRPPFPPSSWDGTKSRREGL